MSGKIYLLIVGLTYLGLAIWCATAPATTSAEVGFTLQGDSGRSEFITVYGGLEFGMALLFLIPWLRSEWLPFSLLACVLIHGSLVLFRTASFLGHSNIEPLTQKLALGEWVIFLTGAIAWYLARK